MQREDNWQKRELYQKLQIVSRKFANVAYLEKNSLIVEDFSKVSYKLEK